LGEEDKKTEMMDLKDMEEKDYRGVLAFIAVGGYVVTVLVSLLFRPDYLKDIIAASTLPILAMEWYFRRNT
jgi:hypothetical protein